MTTPFIIVLIKQKLLILKVVKETVGENGGAAAGVKQEGKRQETGEIEEALRDPQSPFKNPNPFRSLSFRCIERSTSSPHHFPFSILNFQFGIAAGRKKSDHGKHGNRLRRTRKAIGKNTLRASIDPSPQYNVGGLTVPSPKGIFSNCLPCPAKRVSVDSVVKKIRRAQSPLTLQFEGH